MLKPHILEQIRRAKMARTRRRRTVKVQPKWLHPNRTALSYSITLASLMNVIKGSVDANLIPALPGLIARAAAEERWLERVESIMQMITLDLDRMGSGLAEAELYATAMEIGKQVEEFNDRQWRKIMWAVVGVELFQSEGWLAQELRVFAQQNASLIKRLKEDTVERIGEMTVQSLRTGKRHEEFASQLQKIYGTSKHRAKVIARDQISKLNGNLTKMRQEKVGIEKYIWRTSGDRRVRASHRAHEGETYFWDKPPGGTGHPGEDIMCRCTAEAVFPAEMLEASR